MLISISPPAKLASTTRRYGRLPRALVGEGVRRRDAVR